jgi:hypothetical protein
MAFFSYLRRVEGLQCSMLVNSLRMVLVVSWNLGIRHLLNDYICSGLLVSTKEKANAFHFIKKEKKKENL